METILPNLETLRVLADARKTGFLYSDHRMMSIPFPCKCSDAMRIPASIVVHEIDLQNVRAGRPVSVTKECLGKNLLGISYHQPIQYTLTVHALKPSASHKSTKYTTEEADLSLQVDPI